MKNLKFHGHESLRWTRARAFWESDSTIISLFLNHSRSKDNFKAKTIAKNSASLESLSQKSKRRSFSSEDSTNPYRSCFPLTEPSTFHFHNINGGGAKGWNISPFSCACILSQLQHYLLHPKACTDMSGSSLATKKPSLILIKKKIWSQSIFSCSKTILFRWFYKLKKTTEKSEINSSCWNPLSKLLSHQSNYWECSTKVALSSILSS
jgi:hypothetical protein